MSLKPAILSPAQRRVANEMEAVVHLAISGVRSDLPLRARTHTLLVGPSGAGKSHLANTLADTAGVPLWRENVSNWCPMGARGVPTFPALIRWIHSVKAGIIFLDEIDKLFSQSEYSICIRTEIFSLLDLVVPNTAVATVSDLHSDPFEGQLSADDRQLLAKILVEEKLRNRIFILAAGAWQECWEERKTKPIGFLEEKDRGDEPIDRKALLKTIAPELLQRFRREIYHLEPMSERDHLEVLEQQLKVIPRRHRELYEKMIRSAIPAAVRDGLGMRMFEEVYSDFCATLLRNFSLDEFVFKDVMSPANYSAR